MLMFGAGSRPAKRGGFLAEAGKTKTLPTVCFPRAARLL
jgi:hypothetical protein